MIFSASTVDWGDYVAQAHQLVLCSYWGTLTNRCALIPVRIYCTQVFFPISPSSCCLDGTWLTGPNRRVSSDQFSVSMAIKTSFLFMIFEAASDGEMRSDFSSTSRTSVIRSGHWQVLRFNMRFATTSKAAGGVPGFQAYALLVRLIDASKSIKTMNSKLAECVNRDIDFH